jgi:hypothetical protein
LTATLGTAWGWVMRVESIDGSDMYEFLIGRVVLRFWFYPPRPSWKVTYLNHQFGCLWFGVLWIRGSLALLAPRIPRPIEPPRPWPRR